MDQQQVNLKISGTISCISSEFVLVSALLLKCAISDALQTKSLTVAFCSFIQSIIWNKFGVLGFHRVSEKWAQESAKSDLMCLFLSSLYLLVPGLLFYTSVVLHSSSSRISGGFASFPSQIYG